MAELEKGVIESRKINNNMPTSEKYQNGDDPINPSPTNRVKYIQQWSSLTSDTQAREQKSFTKS